VCKGRICGGSTHPLAVIALVIAGIALSGCSSSFSRFSFPTFGLTDSKDAGSRTGSLPPAPKAPVYETQPSYAPSNSSRYDSYSGYGQGTSSRYNNSSYGSTSSVSRAPLPPSSRPAGGDTRRRVAAINPNRHNPAVYAPAPEPSYTTPNAMASARSTTVSSGDTLYNLARRYNVTVGDIRSANGLTGNAIHVGQVLRIPGSSIDVAPAPALVYSPPEPVMPRTAAPRRLPKGKGPFAYRVKSGETLYSIAQKLGLNAKALGKANSVSDPGSLKVGQVLMVPRAAASRAGGAIATPRVAAKAKHRTVPLPTKPVAEKKIARRDKLPAPPSRTSNRFRWPVRGRIISRFGSKPTGLHNDGVNVAVPLGTSVKAAENGVVVYAGNELKGYGNLVLIRHSGNWVSAYAHNNKLIVKRGDKIKRGQIIAKAGKSGMVDQPQLHFELRKGSKPVDPLKYMSSSTS